MVGFAALGQRNESLSLTLVEGQKRLVRQILDRHSGRDLIVRGTEMDPGGSSEKTMPNFGPNPLGFGAAR